MTNKSTEVNIRVFCRFRPKDFSNPNNIIDNTIIHEDKLIEIKDTQSIKGFSNQSNDQSNLKFNLDHIFKPTTSQEEMFNIVGNPVVNEFLQGYNGTIFAYGQTGSGKTHSMFGNLKDTNSGNHGIIPRACHLIFDHINKNDNISEAVIKCSFVEIYNERLKDLMEPKNKIKLRVQKKTTFIENIREEYVTTFEDIDEIIDIGFKTRITGSTKMNNESSRSHCILILTLKQTMNDGSIKISKLNFADLAGSERVQNTGATGIRLIEAGGINKSLSALGNCINALTSNNDNYKHIPFRDSKLTLLLMDSLGGNTKTSLICTLHSSSKNIQESLSTLRFATRAKKITNKVKVNQELSIKDYQRIIEDYKQKLLQANETIKSLQENGVNNNNNNKNEQISDDPQSQPSLIYHGQRDSTGLADGELRIYQTTNIDDDDIIEDEYGYDISQQSSEYDRLMEEIDTKNDEIDNLNQILGYNQIELKEMKMAMKNKDKEINEYAIELQKIINKFIPQNNNDKTLDFSLLMKELKVILNKNSLKVSNIEKNEVQSQKIVHNLKNQLSKLTQISDKDRINSVINQSLNGIDKLNESKLSDNNKIISLEQENERLKKTLSELKNTWAEHLNVLMKNSSNEQNNDRSSIKQRRRSSVSSKFVKPVNKSSGISNILSYINKRRKSSSDSSIKLKGHIYVYFGKKLSLQFFKEYSFISRLKQNYCILTANKLLLYKDMKEANSNTEPIFEVQLNGIAGVLRMENISPECPNKKYNNQEMMVLQTGDSNFIIIKTEGKASREVWIENIESSMAMCY